MSEFDLCKVKSVVVNLDRDVQKLKKFQGLFHPLGIYPQRVTAVNGKALSLKHLIDNQYVDASVPTP